MNNALKIADVRGRLSLSLSPSLSGCGARVFRQVLIIQAGAPEEAEGRWGEERQSEGFRTLTLPLSTASQRSSCSCSLLAVLAARYLLCFISPTPGFVSTQQRGGRSCSRGCVGARRSEHRPLPVRLPLTFCGCTLR